MYVLAKRVDGKDAWTIHGLTDKCEVSDAWYAAGHLVFDIDPDASACSVAYDPIVLDEHR